MLLCSAGWLPAHSLAKHDWQHRGRVKQRALNEFLPDRSATLMPSLRAHRDPVFRKTVPEHEQDNFIAIAGAAQDILSVFIPSLG